MKRFIFILILFFAFTRAFATHQRAAEITFQLLESSTYTYQISLVTYTYQASLADRPEQIIYLGYENKFDTLVRYATDTITGAQIVTNYYKKNHSFPGPGTYIISMTDANRNNGIINVPNSVNTPMYVESMLIISPFLSPPNSSPILLTEPIDEGCVGIPFVHNPGAFDIDGDRLRYSLIPCKTENGINIPGYAMPAASNSLTINSETGDLLWDSPVNPGEYNIAILIEEFRNNTRIGYIIRDMQINIKQCSNHPPVIICADHICIFAGDTLNELVSATDSDANQVINLTTESGILNNNNPNSAHFTNISGQSPIGTFLTWTPDYSHVRNQAYPFYLKVKDNGNPNLTNFKTMLVNVLAKAPVWDSIVPSFDSIGLFWQSINDNNVKGYKIYRRQRQSGVTQDSCQYGMTDSSYAQIADLPNYLTHSYVDKLNLEQSANYCYRIVAYFNNKAESQMSSEICAELKSNTAVITKIDVVETDISTGKIEIQWRKPLDLDISSPEYKYVLYTKYDGTEKVVDTIGNTNDTIYLHQHLNTKEIQYFYSVEIIHTSKTRSSSSIYLTAIPRNKKVLLQWSANTAWANDKYHIFRQKKSTGIFDSIGISFGNQYADEHLDNDSIYCYKVQSFGSYHTQQLPEELTMFSNEMYCTPALDTPCKPILEIINSNCKPAQAEIAWHFDDDCGNENVLHHIFYANDQSGNFTKIDSTYNLSFIYNELENLYGCFYIISSNEKGVFGKSSDTLCLDYESCMNYELPNIFTPNNDGINDVFLAFDNDFSGSFEITIYNRWGNEVFQSNDPAFVWDGVNIHTKQPCPDGSYYYVCNLVIRKNTSPNKKPNKILKGLVTILR